MVQAQETNETEKLRKQLKEMTEKFEKALQEQRQMIQSLSNKLEAVHPTVPPTNHIEVTKPPVTGTRPEAGQAVAAGSERREASISAAQPSMRGYRKIVNAAVSRVSALY